MPFKAQVQPNKDLVFSGKSRKKYWRKNPDDYGNPATEYVSDEQRFIEDMGFEWLGYDGVEGRGLWGGPVWTDGHLYWTYEAYALRSFLDDLRRDGKVICTLSTWGGYTPGVRWVFEDAYEAKRWLREHLVDGYSYHMDNDNAFDLAQKLSDWEFELNPLNRFYDTDND